ncbi:MAG: UDP-glucose/GDP-mannose dehydrogenase family protein [Armatimonadetes bacterium]|nr:UDP-glucose/GDP-mannose dehydrogenase family protein [Armatimonadota bacterium]
MNICVIGTGYVGLVTGAVFSDLGNDVICVDKDKSKIEMLNRGEMPIYEPGLEEMVARNVADARLSFSTDVGEGVRRSEVIFIAVGTPPGEDGNADLSAVIDAAKVIARNIDRYKVVVNKSTVPVGTGDLVRDVIERNKVRDVEFDVVSNPEFLREGSAIADTLYPDRIVIGAPNSNVAMRILELYAPLERPMLVTDVHSAEMIKYASNAFLATKISFINAISQICEKAGADVVQVTKGMGYDSRIGPAFLNAGLGYGGSCFGKDTRCLIHTAEELGYDFKLLRSVVEINDEQPQHFIGRMAEVLGDLEGKTVGVLGLAFKPNTDDMRDAKSIDIIGGLLSRGATVKAYDPIAAENARKVFPQIDYSKTPYDVADRADALAVVTEWNEFKLLNMERLKERMQRPIIFDGRNMYDPQRMRKLGFDYYCIGRCPNAKGTNGGC